MLRLEDDMMTRTERQEYDRNRYQEKRDHIRELQRLYYQRNRKRLQAKKRRYYWKKKLKAARSHGAA